MKLIFGFKGENGKIEVKEDYEFEAEIRERLKKDFEVYLNGHPQVKGLIKGGCYPCTRGELKGIYLCLKFDEIVYIG